MNDRDMLAGPVNPGNPNAVDPADDPTLHANGLLMHRIRAEGPYDDMDDLAAQFADELPGDPERFLALNGQQLTDDGWVMPGIEPVLLPDLIAAYVDHEAAEWGECRDVAATRLIAEALERRGDALRQLDEC